MFFSTWVQEDGNWPRHQDLVLQKVVTASLRFLFDAKSDLYNYLVDFTGSSAELSIAPVGGSPEEQGLGAPAFGAPCHSVEGKLL